MARPHTDHYTTTASKLAKIGNINKVFRFRKR